MKSVMLPVIFCAALVGCMQTEKRVVDWDRQHPQPSGMKSLVERPALDGIAICKEKLMGKDHRSVRAFLGVSDLNHGPDEYIYHPKRKDGSMWLLSVGFAGEKAVEFGAYELLPPQNE